MPGDAVQTDLRAARCIKYSTRSHVQHVLLGNEQVLPVYVFTTLYFLIILDCTLSTYRKESWQTQRAVSRQQQPHTSRVVL